MLRFTKSLWSSTASSRTHVSSRKKQHALRAVTAKWIPSLVVILTTAIILCGCRSERNRTSDDTVDQAWRETVLEEFPVEELPPLPPVDQGNRESDPTVPNVALGTDVSSAGLLRPYENRDDFGVEIVQDQANNYQSSQPDFFYSGSLWENDRNELTASVSPPNGLFTDPQQSSPANQQRVGSSFTYRHLLDDGWISGVSANVDLTDKKPFNSSGQAMEGGVFLKVPQGQNAFWLLNLRYFSSNEWSSPVFRIERTWQQSDWLQTNIGFQLAITDRPQNNLSLNLSVKVLGPASWPKWLPRNAGDGPLSKILSLKSGHDGDQ